MSFSFNFGFKDGKVQAPAPPPPKQATHTPQTTTSTSSSLIETKKTFKVKLEHGTQLLTGATLPLIGSGTWQLNNRQTVRMVESALAEGNLPIHMCLSIYIYMYVYNPLYLGPLV